MHYFSVLVSFLLWNISYIYTVYVPNEPQLTPRPYTSSLTKIPNSKSPDTHLPLYQSSYSKVYVHNNKSYSSSLNALNSNSPGKKVYPIYSTNKQEQKIEDLLEEHNSNIVEKNTLNNRVVYKRRIEKSKQIPVYNTCPKGDSGQFVYDLSCNQYLDCWKGRGGSRNCAPGTLFNPKTLECDFPEKVECITGPGRTSNIVQRSAKLESLEQAECPQGFSGLIPNYTDCSKFIQCNNGQSFSQDCPPGTLFDTTLNICNFADKCTCFSGKPNYLYHKESANYQYGGSHQPVSDNHLGYGWSQSQYHGQYGQASHHHQQSGAETNQQIETSYNYPGSSTGVQYIQYVSCDPNKYNCSQYQESRTVAVGCDSLKQDCGRVTGQNVQTLQEAGCDPSYQNCGQYQQNTGSYGNYNQQKTGYPTAGCNPQYQDCAQATKTTKNYKTICNINDKNCYASTTGDTHQAYHGTTQYQHGSPSSGSHQSGSYHNSESSPKCPGGFQGITKHPTSCKKFLNCANGITYIQECATGTLFNPLNNICDFPHNVKCVEGEESGDQIEEDNNNHIPLEFVRSEPNNFGVGEDDNYGQYQQGNRLAKCQGQSCQNQGYTHNQGGYQSGSYNNKGHGSTGYQWNQGSRANQDQYNQNPGQILCSGSNCYQGLHTNSQNYYNRKPNLTTYSSGQSQYSQPTYSTNQVICQPGQVSCSPCQPEQAGCIPNPTDCQPGQLGCQQKIDGGCPPGYSCQPNTNNQGGYQPKKSSYQPNVGGYQPSQGGYMQPNQGGFQPSQGSYYQPSQGGYYQPSHQPAPQESNQAGYYQPAQENYQPSQGSHQTVPQEPYYGGYHQPSQGGYQQSGQSGYQPNQGGYQINKGETKPQSGYNISQVGVVPCHPNPNGCTPIQVNHQQPPTGQRIKKVYVVEEIETPEGGYGNVYPLYQVEETPVNPPESPQIGGSASNVPPGQISRPVEENNKPIYVPRGEIPNQKGTNRPYSGSYLPPNQYKQNHTYQGRSRPDQPSNQGGYVPVQVVGYKDVQPINKDDDKTYQGYSSQRLPDYVDVFDPSETKANSLASTKKPKVSNDIHDQQVAYSFPEYVFEYEDGEQVTLAPENIVVEKKKKTKCEKGDFRCSKDMCLEKVFVCDEVKDCDDGRDEKNCKDYINQFEAHENSRLDVLEKQRYDNVTQFTCALLCIQNRQFECKSFNYRKIDRACFLTDENIELSGALQTYYPCDYYERKSTAMDCSRMHKCPNGKCLTSDQVCDGFNDCGNREDEKNCRPDDFGYEVKLAGSNSGHEGRVEVTVFNQTGYICDDQFSLTDANVLCKELGFFLGAAEVKGNSHFAKELRENHTLYMMDDLECLGNESSLMDCNFAGWGIHNCGDFEIAGVVCKTPEDKCGEGFWKCDTGNECVRIQFVCDGLDDCTDNSDEASHHCDAPTEVRLVNGTTEKEGRLEVRHHGIWGTVCDDDFNEDAAKIVCKYLGYAGSALVKKEAYYGSGAGPIWLDQVSCLGNETTIEQCTHWEWGEHNCDHSEDVGIVCGAATSAVEAGQVPRNSKSNKDEYVAAESNLDLSYNSVEPVSCGYRKDNIFLQSEDVHFRVVQGSIAKPGDYPWQAALKVKTHDKTAHWCGAVVISSQWVLTAAHCLEGYPKGAYIVVAGEYNIDENEGTEQQAFIEEYYVHEQFRKGHKMGNDIAMIKLKSAGFKLNQDIQPICLPDEHTDYETEDLNCTISGFGTIQTGKSAYSHHLRAAWIPIQKLDICKMAHVYGEQIGDGMICAGDLEGGVDACDGDSGGPLACLDNGVFTLFGVTSWGQRCGYANKPGVYVKVSHYKKWIDKIIKTHS